MDGMQERTPDWEPVLKEDLKRDEGLRLKAYRCTSGVLTIGYGHTGRVKPKDVITESIADELLSKDMAVAIEDARSVCKCFDELDGPRKTVVANMSFNLGAERLGLFQRTLRAICEGRYEDASRHMLASLWAKQVGNRAKRLAARMKTGEW